MRRLLTNMRFETFGMRHLILVALVLAGCAGPNSSKGRVIDISGGQTVAGESSSGMQVAGDEKDEEPGILSRVFGDDADGDGILNNVDRCPDAPEDRDGFQDEDGCPEPDNDGDGILDVSDKCPNEPENLNGFEDADGCPETNLSRAKQAFRDGATAFAQADYVSARRFFEEAYNLKPRDALLYNLAVTTEKQGDRKYACLYYRKWQATSQAASSGQRITSLETCP